MHTLLSKRIAVLSLMLSPVALAQVGASIPPAGTLSSVSLTQIPQSIII